MKRLYYAGLISAALFALAGCQKETAVDDPIEKKQVTFDVVFSFECDRDDALREVTAEVEALYPEYTFVVQPDIDITDLAE